MKIAIVEWYPRICGTGDGAVHLSAGGEELGHTVDRLAFSKSGKQLKAFGEKGNAWTTHKQRDAVAVLNGYDLVIPSDVVCQHPTVDGAAIKTGTMPYYVDVLQRISAPFSLLCWGGYYHAKHNPFIKALLRSSNFTGAVWSPRVPDAKPRFEPFIGGTQIKWVDVPYHPYAAPAPTLESHRRTREILMNSRVTSPKGQDVALQLFQDTPDINWNIWGTSAYGKPSPAWVLWELGLLLGYRQQLFPQLADRTNNKHPEAHKFYTGRFTFGHHSSNAEWRFHDAYESLDDIDWAPWIGISLTNNLLHGSLEYACLDVIARGSVLLAPEHMVEFCQYDSIPLLPFQHAAYGVSKKDNGSIREGKNDWDRQTCLEMIKYYTTGMEEWDLKKIAKAQFRDLLIKHSPATVLGPLVEAS